MHLKRKDYLIFGIIFISVGLFSIIFYLSYPFDPLTSFLDGALILSVIICILGGILLSLAFFGKKSVHQYDPALITWPSIFGFVFLLLFLINPSFFPPFLVLGVLFLGIATYEIWLIIENKLKKD